MSIQPFAAWVLVAAAGVFAAVFAVSHARKVLRRRARRLHYLRLAHDNDGALILRAPVTPAIAPERVASISTDAQQVEPQASNPHPARTREFVLWEATFHSALSDFTELAEHVPPASNSAPTP